MKCRSGVSGRHRLATLVLVDPSATPDLTFCSVLLFLWLSCRLQLSIGVTALAFPVGGPFGSS